MLQMQYKPVLAGLIALTLAACASTPPAAYHTESFDVQTPFEYRSDLPPLVLCEHGKRALLSQGYEVDASSPNKIRGSKFSSHNPNFKFSCVSRWSAWKPEKTRPSMPVRCKPATN